MMATEEVLPLLDWRCYDYKDTAYLAGARADLIDQLYFDRNRAILEIGCENGAAGAYAAKQEGTCGTCAGVEIFASASAIAELKLDRVYTANIEGFDLPEPKDSFGTIIAGEVLEYLADPWRVLKRLRTHLKPVSHLFVRQIVVVAQSSDLATS